jgi:hypothetical protein
MACELLKMATDDNVADSVKLAAIRDALDRAGLAAKTAVEVEVGPPKPYEAILERIEAGTRAEYRRSIGRNDDSGIEYSTTVVDHPRAVGNAQRSAGPRTYCAFTEYLPMRRKKSASAHFLTSTCSLHLRRRTNQPGSR